MLSRESKLYIINAQGNRGEFYCQDAQRVGGLSRHPVPKRQAGQLQHGTTEPQRRRPLTKTRLFLLGSKPPERTASRRYCQVQSQHRRSTRCYEKIKTEKHRVWWSYDILRQYLVTVVDWHRGLFDTNRTAVAASRVQDRRTNLR